MSDKENIMTLSLMCEELLSIAASLDEQNSLQNEVYVTRLRAIAAHLRTFGGLVVEQNVATMDFLLQLMREEGTDAS